jgi:hypothetical protein
MFDRIEKIDFFAVFPAGFYVFVVLFIDYQAFLSPDAFLGKSIWSPVLNLAETVGSKPINLALILFVCYLLGSSLRALPVKWVERLTPPFRLEFPYPDRLKKVLKELASNRKASDFDPERPPIITNDVEMSVFNYWKDTLCIGTHDAFAYYQTFEARTRFFAGMFWSGCIGTVGGTAVLFHRCVSDFPDKYIPLVLSVILVAVFGGQFRRVREQEAGVLVTLFAVHMQKRNISQQDSPPDQRERAPASRCPMK